MATINTNTLLQILKFLIGLSMLIIAFFLDSKYISKSLNEYIELRSENIDQWQSVLTAVGTSFLFVFLLDSIVRFVERTNQRAFRRFFGVSGGLKLVYPTFRLSDESKEAIKFVANIEEMNIYSKKNPQFDGNYFIDLPYAVAANDLQGAVILASVLGKYTQGSVDLITDGSAVRENAKNSMISFGLTSNDLTFLYLRRCGDCLFDINDEEGKTYIAAKIDGSVQSFPYDDKEQHGIILKHTPYPDTHPEIIWFLCGGLKAAGTPAAAWHLAYNWRKYYRRYKDRDFLIIFKTNNEIAAYRTIEIVKIIDHRNQ